MILIGMTGKARHGKDTSAHVLVTEFGFKQYAFASILKSMALALDPVVHQHEDGAPYRLSEAVDAGGWEHAKENPEVRRFLQVLGTEAVRGHLGDNAWVDALDNVLEEETPERAVITDVRFQNEADYIQTGPGFAEVWRINRVNADGSPYDNGLGDGHASEAGVDLISPDVTITASSMDELRRMVRAEAEEAITDAKELSLA